MSTLSDAELRTTIRWMLETAALPPRMQQQQLYAGRGADEPCACCGQPISASDVLYEVASPRHPLLTMHLRCFAAWESECRGRACAAPQPQSSSRRFAS
jgi:hypothetical protein